MGLVYANIQLVNFADETLCEEGYLMHNDIRNIQVRAMADSGAIRLSLMKTSGQNWGYGLGAECILLWLMEL